MATLSHDLRRAAVTRALSLGFTYRQVQRMTGHKDIRMVVRYAHERGTLEENAINFLHTIIRIIRRINEKT
jgi:integrase